MKVAYDDEVDDVREVDVQAIIRCLLALTCGSARGRLRLLPLFWILNLALLLQMRLTNLALERDPNAALDAGSLLAVGQKADAAHYTGARARASSRILDLVDGMHMSSTQIEMPAFVDIPKPSCMRASANRTVFFAPADR